MMIGHWNMSPEAFAGTGFPNFVCGTVVTAGDQNTCRQGSGSVIDYALAHHSIAAAVSIETRNPRGSLRVESRDRCAPGWTT